MLHYYYNFTVFSHNLHLDFPLFFSPSPVAKCEPVLCAYLHGGSGGEAPHSAHSVLLKDLQGLGAFTARRQHHLRLQGERGDLFAGRQLAEEEEGEEEEEGCGGQCFRCKTGYEAVQLFR